MSQASYHCVCPLYPLAADRCPAHRARYVAQQHLRDTIVHRIAGSAVVIRVCEDAGCAAPDWLAAAIARAIFTTPDEVAAPGGETRG